MITLEDVRNAKLADLFCATIVKELTWEERYPLSVEGLPEGVTASDVLLYAVKSTLEERGEMSEKAFDDQCTGANPRYPLIRLVALLKEEAVTVLIIVEGLLLDPDSGDNEVEN